MTKILLFGVLIYAAYHYFDAGSVVSNIKNGVTSFAGSVSSTMSSAEGPYFVSSDGLSPKEKETLSEPPKQMEPEGVLLQGTLDSAKE